ncbi:MAG: hypothetical protein QOF01_926 [Thermomicrobiales bacterium]|jgi:hypothetical protein|nr:hypothetical protein [Thermomicrobiales bacterium]MEA2531408.1 hypothetical protein [Thermomicrobiales bacterium]MEA2594457.1 hypothetical protein [Thermomicrobiales bacterium]
MNSAFRRRRVRIVAAIVLVPVLAAFGFGIYLASVAGDLPWQTDPTRISEGFEPFSGIEGFTTPTRIATRAATPASASRAGAVSGVGTPTSVPTS